MATTTDYDARRVSDNDTPDKSSLRELAPALHGAGTTVVDDDPDDVHFFELPGADLSGEELSVTVIPQRADEFTCSSCFLVQHGSPAALRRRAAGLRRLRVTRGGPPCPPRAAAPICHTVALRFRAKPAA
ncbi:hypothetical protein MOKP106_33690 [Mycobacterium avium subsp. hominissuis]|nr:hypothetical protein L837_4494 [Mycobacterium avium MAV_061107_1842]EUA41871.1 hypothetical protein I549_0437 [Mycobacterium avium subsp. avium 2285 (R)]